MLIHSCYARLHYKLSLNMALSEPQYSLYSTINETNSKIEQGNDSFNSVRRQRRLHSN